MDREEKMGETAEERAVHIYARNKKHGSDQHMASTVITD